MLLATRSQVSKKFGRNAPGLSNSDRQRISESSSTTSVTLPNR